MGPPDEEMEPSPYQQSMLRLLDYIGLQNYGMPGATMPTRSAAEAERIAKHISHVAPQGEGKSSPPKAWDLASWFGTVPDLGENAQPTIYLSAEETLEWKAFLAGTPVEERHAATVRRRLSLTFWRAHVHGLCLWCWFPTKACMCTKLRAYRASLPLVVQNGVVQLTIVLHAEEVFRSTNTGHLAAYLLGAPLRVWGVPADDAYLMQLRTTDEVGDDQGGLDSIVSRVHHLLLYPEKGSPVIDDFIQDHLQSVPGGVSRTAASEDRFHLMLLDSTWGQALSLNRHISRCVPRVSLTINEGYEALFSALRKRTRESGVSTFEAVSMAIEQYLGALGMHDASSLTVHTFTGAMKEFVDIRCLLKFTEPQFEQDGEKLKEAVQRRDLIRREEAQHRQELLERRMRTDTTARRLLLPPVLNYCYCCDRAIGWHRMPEHVLGRRHLSALHSNPTCEPSELARSCLMADFSRAPRSACVEDHHDRKEEEYKKEKQELGE